MKTVKLLFGIFVLVAAVYVTWSVTPHYLNNYRFEDAMEVEARLNAYSTKSERDMQEALYKKARELNLPLKAEQIKVRRDGGEVRIWTEYEVRVNLPGYPLVLKFQPSTTGRRM
jgi:hypothetical protein